MKTTVPLGGGGGGDAAGDDVDELLLVADASFAQGVDGEEGAFTLLKDELGKGRGGRGG